MRFQPRPNLASNAFVRSLAEQIVDENQRRAKASARARFRPSSGAAAQHSGNLADEIIAAYKKAIGEEDDDDEEKKRRDIHPDAPDPDDGDPDDNQATASKILAAAKKAGIV